MYYYFPGDTKSYKSTDKSAHSRAYAEPDGAAYSQASDTKSYESTDKSAHSHAYAEPDAESYYGF